MAKASIPIIPRAPLASEKIQEIGTSYGLNLSGTKDTRPGAVLVLAAFGGLTLAVIALVFAVLAVISSAPVFVWLMLTLAAWSFAIGFSLNRLFLIAVPKLTGLITTNAFGGELHVYGTGLHIRYPWEQFTQDDYIDTRAGIVQNPSRFVSKDGIGVIFKWTEQYGPYLPLLALYVRTEEKAIDEGFVEVVENAIQGNIVGKNIIEILEPDFIAKLRDSVDEALQTDTDEQNNTLEERFGIVVELNTVGPPDFDKDYKEALTGSALRAIVTKDAKQMATELKISEERAAQLIMILNKEAVSQQIFSLQADEQIAKLAPVLMEALRHIGDAGRGVGKVGGTT